MFLGKEKRVFKSQMFQMLTCNTNHKNIIRSTTHIWNIFGGGYLLAFLIFLEIAHLRSSKVDPWIRSHHRRNEQLAFFKTPNLLTFTDLCFGIMTLTCTIRSSLEKLLLLNCWFVLKTCFGLSSNTNLKKPSF